MIDLTDLSIYVGCLVEYEYMPITLEPSELIPHTIPRRTKTSLIIDTDIDRVYVAGPGGFKVIRVNDIIDIKAPLTESELLIRRL